MPFFAVAPDSRTPAADDHNSEAPETDAPRGILGQNRIGLVVATYQAGKVILARNDDGTINASRAAWTSSARWPFSAGRT